MTANSKETGFKEICDKLDQNQKILVEIARWIRFQNISKLNETLLAELDTDEKKLAFENTDGVLTLDEVAKVSGVSRDTLYGWWKRWSNLGILEPSEIRKGRLKKFCSLEYLGIKVPKGSVKTEKSSMITSDNPVLQSGGSLNE